MRPSPAPVFRAVALVLALMGASSVSFGADDPQTAADDAAGLRGRAEKLIADSRYGEAVPLLDEILRTAPRDGRAYEDRGLARWRALTEIADRDDGFATIQARMCIETERVCPDAEAALSDLDHAIVLLAEPARAKALSERARIHLRLGHDALALTDEDEAIRLDPGSAPYREDRAVLRDHLGNENGAMADLDAVLQLRPGAGADLVMRAELRRRQGDVAGARADLDEALSHVPPGPEPDWLDEALTLRRAVAAPGEPGMGAESGPLKVEHAETTADQDGRPTLSLTFDRESAKRLAAYTSAHVGSEIEIVADGQVVSKPRILSPITGGLVVISGNFSPGEIGRLARTLGAPDAAITLREAR